MLFTPSVGLILFFYVSTFMPLSNIHYNCVPSNPTSRWLAYFFCLNLISTPLFLIPHLPLRYEILLVTSAFLAYDDARGAHALFVFCILPRMNRVKNVIQEHIGDLTLLPSLPSPLTNETVKPPSPVPSD